MKVLQALLDSIAGTEALVESVCIGAFVTAVSTRYTGLASSYREDKCRDDTGPVGVKGAGSLRGRAALDLAEYALSGDTLEASVGLATINSLLDVDEARCQTLSAGQLLAECGLGLDVAIIGHFPFAEKMRMVARNLWVVERRPQPGDIDEASARAVLPRCHVVCITGTSLVNRSLEGLLQQCPQAYVVLTGPTAPLSPVLFDFGVDAICGARVVDRDAVQRRVMEGATFRTAREAGVRLLTMVKQ